MRRETFNQTMMLLAAIWPERSPSKETLAAYWLALSHLPDDAFRQAAHRCIQECTFFPKPAEILARVDGPIWRELPPLTWDELTPMEQARLGPREAYETGRPALVERVA